MRRISLLLAMTFFGFSIYSQSPAVGIGTNAPHSSAALEVNSNNKGVLLTRMTSVQRRNIASPLAGLLVFDTDKGCLFMFDGVQWLPLVATTSANIPPVERVGDSVKSLDHFGFAVDIDADCAVVGAPADMIGSNYRQGSAYVFERINGNWVQTAQLTANDGMSSDNFGYSVAVGDGYIAIGSPFDDSGVSPILVENHGSVYIFHKVGNSWIQEFKVRPSDFSEDDQFGRSVSIDNNNLVVGAPYDEFGAITSAGSVYFFQRSGTSWNQLNKMYTPSAQQGDFFGSCVRIAGSYVIAGAPGAVVSGTDGAGTANIYVFGGGTWNYQTTLNNPFPAGTPNFGSSVDIDDTIAVIGRPGSLSTHTGSVHTYRRTGSTWTSAGQTFGPGTQIGFGKSISLSGNFLIVSRYLDQTNTYYLFERSTFFTQPSWDLVREVGFSRPPVYYGQESYYPDKDIVAISGENCVVGHPLIALKSGYRSGGILFLSVSP